MYELARLDLLRVAEGGPPYDEEKELHERLGVVEYRQKQAEASQEELEGRLDDVEPVVDRHRTWWGWLWRAVGVFLLALVSAAAVQFSDWLGRLIRGAGEK